MVKRVDRSLELEIWQKIKKWIIFMKNGDQEQEVFYIGGAEVLPPPLENAEEQNCLFALSNIEREKSTISKDEAKNKLIAHNLRLVVYLAKKFENTGVGVEDLISIGSIGLIKGINTFDPDKNIKLATYASRCIENEILMYLRRNSKTKLEVSFDEPLNMDWDGRNHTPNISSKPQKVSYSLGIIYAGHCRPAAHFIRASANIANLFASRLCTIAKK